MAKRMLTSGEAARLMNVSKPTIHYWMRKGRLKPDATTSGGHHRFSLDAVRKMNESRFKRPKRNGRWSSPLRYPGGKSKAVPWMLPFVPKGARVASPFVGGGSFELALCANGHEVVAYDGFRPLATFWREVLAERDGLVDRITGLLPVTKTMFYDLKRMVLDMTAPAEMAAAYFVVNRMSFSGVTMCGGMSPATPAIHSERTKSAAGRIRRLETKGLHVEQGDFRVTIPRHANDFLYCDPPYMLGSKADRLYGNKGSMHKGFDHEALAELLNKRDGWLLSYNDCPGVRELYSGCEFVEAEWKYFMNKSGESNEVLILPKGG